MKKLKSEIRKMRGMKPREALDYFWTYYKIHLMFLAIIIFFAVLILQANFGKKQELVFAAMLVDTGIPQAAADSAAAGYAEWLELDGETQHVTLDASVNIEGGTVAGLQKLMVSVAAGEIDALITDLDVADYELKGGALSDLQVVLPEETLAHWHDRLLYADADALAAWVEANRAGEAEQITLLSPDPAGMARPVPVGVDITEECRRAFQRPAEYGQLIYTVAVTTRRQEESARFLTYLQTLGGAA